MVLNLSYIEITNEDIMCDFEIYKCMVLLLIQKSLFLFPKINFALISLVLIIQKDESLKKK